LVLAIKIYLLKGVEKRDLKAGGLIPLLAPESLNAYVPSVKAINIAIVDPDSLILGLRPLL
jgi:hypothetical protein